MRTYPWAVPFLVGAAFVSALVLSRTAPEAARLVIPAIMLAATGAVAAATYGLARIGHDRRVALLTSATPAVLVAGAFGCFLIVETSAGRLALAAATVMLAAVYLAYLRGMVRGDERFRVDDFSHFSFAVHVVSVFFVFAFAFGVTGYLRIPVPLAAFVVAVTILLATAETLRRAGLANGSAATISAMFVALGVQLYLALSFLPTSHLVNAAVGTVLYAAGLHAVVAALADRAPAPAFRRQFALSLLLVVIMLSTARWA
mgnify:FL=1